MFTFLNGLDDDLRKVLLIQLRNLWTHTSTAIEGNTLALFHKKVTKFDRPCNDDPQWIITQKATAETR